MDTRRCSLPLLSMPLLDTPCSDMYEYATPLLDKDSITSSDVTSSSPTPSSMTSSAPPVVCCDNRQLDVIVHRDGSGYGFSISGDTPVSICHVKPDGPAIRAGVCLRDRIVKVNGRHVTGLTHTEVVDHIASSSSVLLTLERSPKDATNTQQQHTPSHSTNIPGSPFSSVVTPVPAASVSRASVLTPPPTGSSAMSLDSRSMANRPLPALPASEPLPKVDKKVTAPLPADDVARRHWDTKTTHTIRLMLEEQERHLDKLRAQLAVLGTTAAAAGSGQLSAARIRQHVLSAESRRDQLMAKLRQAAAVDNEDAGVDEGVAAGAVLPSSSSKSTPNCSSVPPVPLARASLTPSAVPVVSPSSSATRSSSPPPLPQRNRSFPTAIPASVPIPATRSRLPLPLPNAYSSSSNIGPLHPLPVTSVSSTDQSSTEKLNTYSTTPTSSKTTPTTFKTTSPYSKASLTVALNSPHAALLPPRKTPLLTSTPTSGVQTPPALPPRTYRQQSLTDDNTAASEAFPTKTGMSALSALSHSTTSLLGNRVLTALSSEVTNSASTTTNSSSTCCDDNGAAERIASDTSTSVLSTAGSDGDLAKQRRDSHGPRRVSEFGSLSELSTAAAAGGTSAVISTRADMSSSCRAAQPYSQRRDSYTPNKNNESGSCRMSSTSPTRSSGPLRTPPGTPPPPYVDIDSPTGTSPVCRSVSVITAQTPTAIPARRSNSQVPFDDTSNAFKPACSSSMKPACSSSMKPVAVPAPVIMTIEDDDLSEQETSQEDCHGAFSSVREVMSRHAHLAVFMNFVISNCNPSSLFFYMITSLYEGGSPKEMRRWAYEIYSSFLLQGATMLVPNITETILSRISSTLQNESDRADKLKSVFARARREALSEVSRQLAEFRCKRTAGLGSMFGPLDQRLDECYQEKGGKMRVVEDVLVRKLETIQNSVGDWDGADLRDSPAQWLLCCLSTVLYRHFGSRSVQVLTAVDLLPMFVGKERSLKHKLLTKYKKTAVGLGHHLQSHQYNDIAYCTVCNDLIRGVSPQALQCSHCEMNVHRYCLSAVDEQCVGRRSNDKISKFIGRIRNEPRRRNLPASPSTTSCSSSALNHQQGSPIDVQHCESNGSD